MVRETGKPGYPPYSMSPSLTLLMRPVNTLLVIRAAANAGTRPALAHAAFRRAGYSRPKLMGRVDSDRDIRTSRP
jgi:hypothetical protein